MILFNFMRFCSLIIDVKFYLKIDGKGKEEKIFAHSITVLYIYILYLPIGLFYCIDFMIHFIMLHFSLYCCFCFLSHCVYVIMLHQFALLPTTDQFCFGKQAFSRIDRRAFCLAHLFTYQPMADSVGGTGMLGLSYVASPDRTMPGGICSRG